MSVFIVDVEADGPIPGDYSMIEVGAVKLTRCLQKTFYVDIRPMATNFKLSALESIGRTRKETLNFTHAPAHAMFLFKKWIEENNKDGTRPVLFSDNNGFDFMFTHWYFVHFIGNDPFGWTSRNLQDIFKGMKFNMKNCGFKGMRKTKHDHNPVNDAIGNAEALLVMVDNFNLKGVDVE